ncbi:hypothetical protein BJY24_007722 [Nocardia transvalensis]|uniref:Uncharacterized protein n=1 Tax=Nocardia transvalensis TaxID=37333 RepID=A0A7W9UNG7_9NOCA|nr:hypothetical protein [Nocardia transvalensis]MBB5918810.1 hypothetical protein [Nocardia transvalensis]
MRARPALITRSREPETPDVTFFTRAYATRALPLSAVTLAMLASGTDDGLVPLLTVAGAAQIGDGLIGIARRNWPMTAGCAVATAVHLGSAWWIGAR